MLSTLRSSAALTQRLAAMGERDDDAVPRTHEPEQLVLGLGEPAGRDRRPLRLELECLPSRERIELGGAVERDRRQALLVPDRAHLVRLPDEIGRRDRWARPGHPGSTIRASASSSQLCARSGSMLSLRRSAAG